jgi:putative ABC transport system permease protein
MTLIAFIARNALRSKRRTVLTTLSIGLSLLLLTLLMNVWRTFYFDRGTAQSAQRLIIHHRVSLDFDLPGHYREKLRAVPGIAHVIPLNWFGGQYKDDRPENFFAQLATDPEELFGVYPEYIMPADQLRAWQHDRAGAIVDAELANKHSWKVGDRLNLKGSVFPVDLQLTIRGIFTAPAPTQTVYFDNTYFEESFREMNGECGFFAAFVDPPGDLAEVSRRIDDNFHNQPEPIKSESERVFQLGIIQMLGNVKAFILGISLAVTFTVLLVSANTIAMSVRERIREIAVLKTLGFTGRRVFLIYMGEALLISFTGGILGIGGAAALLSLISTLPLGAAGLFSKMEFSVPVMFTAILASLLVGFVSAFPSSYHASNLKIAEGLKHIG